MKYFKPKLKRMTTFIKAVTLSLLAQQYQANVSLDKKLKVEYTFTEEFLSQLKNV